MPVDSAEFGAGIPNEQLRPEDVPTDPTHIYDILHFALSYDAYAVWGGFNVVADYANAARMQWAATGTLPAELDGLRACLFFEQRRLHHLGAPVEDDDVAYLVALAQAIRATLASHKEGRADTTAG